MNNIQILNQFKEFAGENAVIWSHGKHTFMTDNHILLRVPRCPGVYKKNIYAEYSWRFNNLFLIYPASVCVPAKDFDAICEAYFARNPAEPFEPADVNGVRLDHKYLQFIGTLPGAVMSIVDIKYPVGLRFNGGIGQVMQMERNE